MENLKIYLKKSSFDIFILIVCIAVSLSLAFNKSIGIDESFSIDWSAWDMPGFWNRIQLDVCPIYLILLRPIMLLTNKSLLAGKLFSWVCFCVCILAGYCFVRKEFGRISYTAYCLMFVGTPLILEKTVEVRMYAIAYAMVVISAIMAYKIICPNTKLLHWFWFVLCGLMASYTHYFTLLSLVLIYIGLFLWFLITKNVNKIIKMCICSLMMILGYGPWLTVIFKQTKSETTSWIPPVESRLAPIRDLFDTHIFQIKPYMMIVVLVLTIVAMVLFISQRNEKSFWAMGCISIAWVIMIFGEIFQIYFRPILVDRYMTIPFCLFILGMSYFVKFIRKNFAIALCIVFLCSCIVSYPGLHEELYVTNVESNAD